MRKDNELLKSQTDIYKRLHGDKMATSNVINDVYVINRYEMIIRETRERIAKSHATTPNMISDSEVCSYLAMHVALTQDRLKRIRVCNNGNDHIIDMLVDAGLEL